MKKLCGLLYLMMLSSLGYAQNNQFLNPIIPGGYPDPSITKDDDYFYIVNSTFEYFPGLPIHRSKDLVNWELIGHGLHREEQASGAVNLIDVRTNDGIHAPTMRYHNGVYHIISTNVYRGKNETQQTMVNFVITATDPKGPWSDPYVIEGAPGIDPDIFFDDNGDVWYVGQGAARNPTFPGEGEIWIQQLNPKTWQLQGERHYLWTGACGGVWAEGPHMYKIGNTYYLLIAEGGTGHDHAVMIAQSDSPTGPFRSNPRNPILTSRHLSYKYWVGKTGHGDLIQLKDGRWYMVALGVRTDVNGASNMGRETFMVPVEWELSDRNDLWPVVAPMSGKIDRHVELPFKERPQYYQPQFSDDFESDTLNLQWNFRRVPEKGHFVLNPKESMLSIKTSPNLPKDQERASFIGFRQTETDFSYQARIEFTPEQERTEGGIMLMHKDNNYISYSVLKEQNQYFLQVALAAPNKEREVLKRIKLQNYQGAIVLKVNSQFDRYEYSFAFDDAKEDQVVHTTTNDLLLYTGYTGAYLGLFTTSNGQPSSDTMDVDWVKYQGFIR